MPQLEERNNKKTSQAQAAEDPTPLWTVRRLVAPGIEELAAGYDEECEDQNIEVANRLHLLFTRTQTLVRCSRQ